VDILDDMGVSKLSAKVFLKKVNYSFDNSRSHHKIKIMFLVLLWEYLIKMQLALTFQLVSLIPLISEGKSLHNFQLS